MIVLRIVRASFFHEGEELVAPFDLTLGCGERAELSAPDALGARLLARVCAGIVKPTTGCTYIADFDARLQPAQAKRCVAFVAGAAPRDFAGSLELLAAAFRVEPRTARARAAEVMSVLGENAYARSAALALVHDAALIVLDRPPAGVAGVLAALRPGAALVEAHVAPAAPQPLPELRALEVLR